MEALCLVHTSAIYVWRGMGFKIKKPPIRKLCFVDALSSRWLLNSSTVS